MCDDPRFSSHATRGEHQAELDAIVAEWSATLPAADLLALMEAHLVPAGPICDAAQVATNPHFRERGAVVDVADPELGTLSMQGVVPRLSETPGDIRWTGPALGEHSEQILAERLGLNADNIAALRAKGAV